MPQAQDRTRYPPIADYGLIGNLHTTALVSLDAAIDFFCFPRFDSPTVFGALLDRERGGRFSIAPQLNGVSHHQQYLPNTNVLLTRFLAEEGMAEVTDFFRVDTEHPEHGELMRSVTVIRGTIEFHVRCDPRFDYGRAEHAVRGGHGDGVDGDDVHGDALAFVPGRDDLPRLRLVSDRDLSVDGSAAVAEFSLGEGESACFLLEAYDPDTAGDEAAARGNGDPDDVYDETLPDLPVPGELRESVDRALHQTIHFWKHWVGQSTYRGEWFGKMRRSALTLKLLTSAEFGAPVAAATFGLPEELGGERNWDYRYTWIRDAAFTMYAFIRLGFVGEARGFMEWIQQVLDEQVDCPGGHLLQLMYRVDGSADLEESELDWAGYRGSRPVRIGNAASGQVQLDIYGELMDSIYLYDKYGEPCSYAFWRKLTELIDYVVEHWRDSDHGIWEVRGGEREFLYSRVMCWVAVDRGIRLAEKRSFPYDLLKWRTARDEIFADVYDGFYDEELGAFVQYRGAKSLDAAALLMPLVRFISPLDPRWRSTLAAIERELVTDTMVYRYRNRDNHDGLSGEEGTFSVCSFWYVECLCRGGDVAKAELFFEKMLGYGNHLGLFAEEISLTGEQLGNFPQAFTHLGLISAGFAIDRALNGAGAGVG